MSQNNEGYEMDPYRQHGKGSGNGGVFLGGLAVGMILTMLIVGVIGGILAASGVFDRKTDSVSDQQSALEEIRNQSISEYISSVSSEFVTPEMATKIDGLVGLIKSEFFLSEVTDEQLEDGLYQGLLNSLGDVYSEYYTKEQFQELMMSSEGVYYGIGAYVSMDPEYNLPKIAGVFKNSPAEEAGLRNNDIIYMVNGEMTTGKTLSEVVSGIKGEENTQVTLTIVRDGEQLEKIATRRKVETPTVESEMLEDGMGYVRLVEFDDVTTNQFLEAMDELYANGMKGLILDLRGNPGGNLSTVVQIAQNLLPKGTIVYTEDKKQNRDTYTSKGNKEIKIPMVVLVDMNSASASEILAGAIQDYGKGTLVGTKTFGKGIVQSIIPMRDGSAIKITVSGYFTPKGRNIHKVGIEPDIVCEFDSERYYDADNPVDNQLEKAKEVLKEKMR